MPKGYWIVHVDVKNDEGYRPYVLANAAIFKKFGGRFVVRTDKITSFDGTPPQRFVLVAFDSPEKAQAWHTSAAMKDIDAARMKTTDSLSFMVESMPQ